MRVGLRLSMADLFCRIPAALSCSGRSVRVEQPARGQTVNNPRSGVKDRRPFSSTLHMAESTGVESVSLLREPLFSRQVAYRPADSPSKLSKNKGILVGPVGVEPTKGCS